VHVAPALLLAQGLTTLGCMYATFPCIFARGCFHGVSVSLCEHVFSVGGVSFKCLRRHNFIKLEC
jgi:hypothetical protein